MTPQASELLALADRVEAATGRDRALDLLVWEAVEPVSFSYAYHQELGMMPKAKPQAEQARIARNRTQTRAPKVTASLDAAMRLVPWDLLRDREYLFSLEQQDDECWVARADQRADECGGGETIMSAPRSDKERAVTAFALRALATGGGV